MRSVPAVFQRISHESAGLLEQIDQPFFVAAYMQLTTHIVQHDRELVSLLPGVEFINVATFRMLSCHIHLFRCLSIVEAYQDTSPCSRAWSIDSKITAMIFSLHCSRLMTRHKRGVDDMVGALLYYVTLELHHGRYPRKSIESTV